MPREPKPSRKSGVRQPKVARKGKQNSRIPPEDDDDDKEDDWVKDLRRYLQQHLVMYLAKTHLNPEQHKILKEVVQQYIECLENNAYMQHSNSYAWRKVLEKYN